MYLTLKQITLQSHLLEKKYYFHFSYILKIRNKYQKKKGYNSFVFTEDASNAGLMDGLGPKRTSYAMPLLFTNDLAFLSCYTQGAEGKLTWSQSLPRA